MDDGLPPTELSIAFVGELSSRRKKQHFSKKSTLRIIASMRRVSKYQMGREGMCGKFRDCLLQLSSHSSSQVSWRMTKLFSSSAGSSTKMLGRLQVLVA